MARKLPAKDVVIVGLGWTGAVMAEQLTSAGLDVVAIERGPWRDTASDFPSNYAPDELRFEQRQEMFLRPAQETITARNTPDQVALPMRSWGSFYPGNGVGGAGVHWNGEHWRFLPTDFVLKTHLTQRYGASFLPENMQIQDWGVTYEELEPYYLAFERLVGTAGKAGNLNGVVQEGGNPFEGPRSAEYPQAPLRQPYGPTLFAEAARNLGYKPFPQPSANSSGVYTNALGCTIAPCTFCGFCERYGCGNYSKASAQVSVLPALIRRPGFQARTECEVLRVNLDRAGKRAISVTYVDAQGEEWEQPGEMVLLCAFQLHVVRLLLLSGIGTPYNPSTGEGTLGRNYSYQVTSAVDQIFKDKIINPWIGAGAIGMMIDEFNGDNFDHGPLGFVGGGYLGGSQTNGRPINYHPTPEGTPRWGARFKRAVAESYNKSYRLQGHGSCYSYRANWLDLDPTYKDRFGRPLLRMTFDFGDNERKMSAYITDRLAEIGHAMGPEHQSAHPRKGHWSTIPYQTTHTVGGAVMGTDPATSVVNRYLQHWDVPNLFVFGAGAFPQNGGYNPTGTIGALTYWAADAIRNRYLKNPGPLA